MSQLTRRQLLTAGTAAAVVPFTNPLGFDLRSAKKIQVDFRLSGAKELHSVCPYCAVGCALIAYTKQDASGKTQLLQIEGDPDSPVNEGRLCPKGATAMQLATSSRRVEKPLYRAPGSTKWEEKSWDWALERIAARVKETRDKTFKTSIDGRVVNRTEAIACLGGSALDNEEAYALVKLMRALGLVYVEHQARL